MAEQEFSKEQVATWYTVHLMFIIVGGVMAKEVGTTFQGTMEDSLGQPINISTSALLIWLIGMVWYLGRIYTQQEKLVYPVVTTSLGTLTRMLVFALVAGSSGYISLLFSAAVGMGDMMLSRIQSLSAVFMNGLNLVYAFGAIVTSWVVYSTVRNVLKASLSMGQ